MSGRVFTGHDPTKWLVRKSGGKWYIWRPLVSTGEHLPAYEFSKFPENWKPTQNELAL